VKGKKGFDDPRLSQDTEFNQNILINGFINYETSIADIHNIKFMVGGERRTGQGDRFNAYRRFFVSTAVDQLFAGGERDMLNGGSAFQSARLNYFGRVNYNFLEKYLVEFVWRYDGSYIFPENKRYGFFPGISAGWRISEEGFFKDNVAFVNNLKIRGSWGQTGNDRIAEYQYLSSYAYGRFDATGNYDDSYRSPFMNESYIFGIDQENKALYEALIPNRNVTWEVANQSNIGFEAQLLDNKISLEADYFYNRRSEILIKRNASIPGSTGLTLPRENIGKVANQGFDFSVGYNNNIGDFNYQVNLNAGYAINKILFWDEAAGVPSYQQSTGSPMFTDVFYEATGIFRDEEQVNNTPHFSGARPGDIIFRDVNNDGTIDANDRVRSKYNDIPRWNGGLNLNMQFKGFDLAILFQGAAGAVQYVSTESGEIGNFLKSFYDQRWTAENPNASGPRTFNRDNEYWRNNRNTHFLHKTDYIRLKNLQLGYTLPLNVSKKVGMQGVRFYVSGFNLLTYSPDFKDFDPESNNASGQGYPLQKVFNGGLTLTF
jgi:TonB-linked SusC/RagA family outer membrane protein